MNMFKAIVNVNTANGAHNIVIPCCTSEANALQIVANMEQCPMSCLSVVSCEPVEYATVKENK